jgi:predicted ATP-dependent serine protease
MHMTCTIHIMPCNRTGRDQRDSVEGLDFELTLLAGRSPTGPCLLLRGDSGIGKTSLLDAAAVQAGAAGMLVLRASGVQSEAEISFSALHQTRYPDLAPPVRRRLLDEDAGNPSRCASCPWR